jgi:protocatechuate 3,4-dioxygenase beta subunit
MVSRSNLTIADATSTDSMKEPGVENHGRDLYDLGLAADLSMLRRTPVGRRRVLSMGLAGIGLLLVGCGAQGQTAAPAATSASAAPAADGSAAACVSEIPSETAGPYPADGSNASNQTLNVLATSGIVRQDLRTSLGTGNVAAGVPLTIELTLVNTSADCAPLSGYAVYAWHCTREGEYSLYSSSITGEDFLRGVQGSDASGVVTFSTIFPGCYAGRWPHVHFEIYPSLDAATSSASAIHTSQLGLPEDACQMVYATDGYAASVRNLASITLDSDNVFGDGHDAQIAAVTGDAAGGYTARLTVGINA